jgi:hypothetical protein
MVDSRFWKPGDEAAWNRTLLADVPVLVLSLLFLAAAAYHALLYLRRRQEKGHLWFSLLSLCFAVNTFASSYWIYQLTDRYDLAVRASDLTGHLAALFAIQFLWTFFSRPVPRLLRAYQLSHGALALFVGLWPDVNLVVASQRPRMLWLLPLLVVVAALVLREMWRGDVEARLIAAGGMILIAVEAVEMAGRQLALPWSQEVSLVPFGFAVVLVDGRSPVQPLPARPRRARPAASDPGGSDPGAHRRSPRRQRGGAGRQPGQERVPRQHEP